MIDRSMQFLAGLVRLPLTTAVLDRYGVLGAFLDARGRPIPQNDLWIAAAAAVAGAVVLTTDTDFDVLHEHGLVERDFVHPQGPANRGSAAPARVIDFHGGPAFVKDFHRP